VKIPKIGITTYGRDEKGNFYLPGEYVDSVRAAGGLPLMLAPGESNIAAILEILDGIIFAGGGDFDPAVYDGEPHPTIARTDAERDSFELALAKAVFQTEMPVLGICRGFQLLNIVTGGDLIAHLPEKYGEEIDHREDNGDEIEHEIEITSGKLSGIFSQNKLKIMSKHHQALGKIADCWQVTANAADGVIEALEHKTHPWMVAVLWHPELSPNDPEQERLFEEFVRVSREFSK